MCRGRLTRNADRALRSLPPTLLLVALLGGQAAPVRAQPQDSAVRAGASAVDPAEYEGIDRIIDEAERRYFRRLNPGSKRILQAFLRKAGVRDGKAVPLTQRRLLILTEPNASAAQINNGVFDLGGDLSSLDLDEQWDQRLIAYSLEEIQGLPELNYLDEDGVARVPWIRKITPYANLAVGAAIVRDLKDLDAAGGTAAIEAFLAGGEEAPAEEEVRWIHDRLLRRFWWLDRQLPDAEYGTLPAPGLEDPAVKRVRDAYGRLDAYFKAREHAVSEAGVQPGAEDPQASVLGN